MPAQPEEVKLRRESQPLQQVLPSPTGNMPSCRPVLRGCLLAGVVFTVLFRFSSVGVLAQETLGGVRGTVRGRVGHPIPGAEVTAKNLATGTSHKVSSNGKGEFEILRLESGVYAIQVTGPGF